MITSRDSSPMLSCNCASTAEHTIAAFDTTYYHVTAFPPFFSGVSTAEHTITAFDTTYYHVTAFPPFFSYPFNLITLSIALHPANPSYSSTQARQDVYVRKKLHDSPSSQPTQSCINSHVTCHHRVPDLINGRTTCNSLQKAPQTTANMHVMMTL